MPLFPATTSSEQANLVEYVEHSLVNARSIVAGLTGDQLRARPIPSSELTLGWLILHIGEVAETWLSRAAAGLASLRAADLDAEVPVPTEMPWFPTDLPAFNARWVALHVLGEINRHSGHADILREAIDGGTMYDLIARDQGIDMSYIGAWFAAHPEVPMPQW